MARKKSTSSAERYLRSKEPQNLPLTFKDKRQVDLDLQRVPLSKAARAKLERRVATVLSANEELSYYQGFHDIAMHTHTTKQLENLALQQLRDFMAASIVPTQQILALIPDILWVADQEGVGSYFDPSYGTHARLGYFAVAPIVTLFSHHTDDSQVILPIIRSVLKEGLQYILYLYAALLLESPQLFVNKDGEKIGVDEIDMALSRAGELLTAENYVLVERRAHELRQRHPLKKLPAFKHISRHSVLRTGKVTKRTTALYLLKQLDYQSDGASSKTSVRSSSRFAMMALAVGALALGMFLSRTRK